MVAQFVNAVGDGAFSVSSALHFTRIVGLSAPQIGAGLAVAWAVGSAAGVPLGHLADRRGPRGTAVPLALATAASVASFLLPRSFVPLLCAAVAYATAQSGLAAARQVLLAGLVGPAARTRAPARLQAVLNGGLAVGAALGGLALHAGTRSAYPAVFALDAAAFLGCAPVLGRLPAGARPGAVGRRAGARGAAGPAVRAARGAAGPAVRAARPPQRPDAAADAAPQPRPAAVDRGAYGGSRLDRVGAPRPQHRRGDALPGPCRPVRDGPGHGRAGGAVVGGGHVRRVRGLRVLGGAGGRPRCRGGGRGSGARPRGRAPGPRRDAALRGLVADRLRPGPRRPDRPVPGLLRLRRPRRPRPRTPARHAPAHRQGRARVAAPGRGLPGRGCGDRPRRAVGGHRPLIRTSGVHPKNCARAASLRAIPGRSHIMRKVCKARNPK
ncbi:MFS transporter [Streptomyces sp. NPDC057244]|uniref:MFS transporter n=1 Tax=Streptomyces sp. NPDC057244 TaxID=3346064 RepID=UPI0036357DB4